MKRIIISVYVIFIFTVLIGCGNENIEVEEKAQVIEEAFSNKDMSKINNTIFGTEELIIDDEISELWEENDESKEGVLEYIFEYVDVNVLDVYDDVIEYKVEAPDMKDVFNDIDMNTEEITEDDLLQYIKNYVNETKKVKSTVALEYVYIDDELIVNYQSEEFINAITGGLLDAYKELYTEMLEEYMKGVE